MWCVWEFFGMMDDDCFEVWMLVGEFEVCSVNVCVGEFWLVEIWCYVLNGSGGFDVIVFFDVC